LGGVKSQTINICTNFCSKDLSGEIGDIEIAETDITYCKKVSGNCITVNNFDVLYKENNCPHDPENGLDDCEEDLSTVLNIHVYYPSNHNYEACKLPAVILFHGGSYAECSDYDNAGIVALGNKLAKRGFVVFNVNYRVGVIVDQRIVPGSPPRVYPPGVVTYTTAQQWLAIYRAMQDARGAIRSIIKMEREGFNDDKYQINENKIFLGGISAGSVIAMAAEYYKDQLIIDEVFPNVKNSLGDIDLEDVYYAEPGEVDYFEQIAGILNCWGSLVIPAISGYFNDPYSFFSGQGYNLPPIISFHGKEDETFNYQYQGVYFSTYDNEDDYEDLFQNEDRCLDAEYIATTINDNFPDFILIGSQTIYEMLKDNTISCELYLDCEAGHGLDDNDPDCTSCAMHPGDYRLKSNCLACLYQSNFGLLTANTREKPMIILPGVQLPFSRQLWVA